MAKVSISFYNRGVWTITADGLEEDMVVMTSALEKAESVMSFWVSGTKEFVTHDSTLALLRDAADSLAESSVWFDNKQEYPYEVTLSHSSGKMSITLDVITIWPTRGKVPPFA